MHYRHVESIAIINFLLDHGAGIGADYDDIKYADFKNVYLLIGLQDKLGFLDNPRDQNQIRSQIRTFDDIIIKYNDGALSRYDLDRFDLQANNALKYGDFDYHIVAELFKIKQTIEYCRFIAPGQVKPQAVRNYIASHKQIITLLLQVEHQLVDLPLEILHHITAELAGVDQNKVEMLRHELIVQHAEDHPQILNRLA